MLETMTGKLRPVSAALVLLAGTTGTTFAQDQAVAPATVTLAASGNLAATEFTASDVSIYVSEVAGYDGTPSTSDMSLSLSGVAPVNTALLQWATRKPGKGKEVRDVTISVAVTEADGKERQMVYELTDARVTSFAASHSSYSAGANLSLQVVAKSLSIDGIAMK